MFDNTKPLQILILEDQISDAELELAELRRAGFTFQWKRVDNEQDYLAALDPSLDLILADFNLPQFDGQRALKLLRERELDVPFILVSGAVGEEIAVQMMKDGAADYLLKDRIARLGQAVMHALEEKQLRLEHEHAQEKIAASEAELRALFTSMTDAVLVYDRDGRCLDIAPTKIGNLFLSSGVMLGKTVHEIIPKEKADFLVEKIRETLQSGEVVDCEFSLKIQGTDLWVSASSSPLSEDRVVMVAHDISNRKHAENTIRQRLAELEAINRLSTNLRSAQTLDEMLELLLDTSLAMLGSDAGIIWLYDRSSDLLRETLVRGWFKNLHDHSTQRSNGIAGLVFALGEPILSAEFASDPHISETMRPQIPPGWGGACIPIRTEREIIGALMVAVPSQRKLGDEDVRLLMTISEISGNAIRRAALYEQSERQVQRLTALRAIDEHIANNIDLEMTLEAALKQIQSLLQVDAADVLLFNSETQTLDFHMSIGFRTDALKHTHLRLGEGYAGIAALEQRTIQLTHLKNQETDFLRSPHFAAEDFVTYFCVPLIAKDNLEGVLEVFHRSALHADQEWMDALSALAGQVAIAIDNALLFAGLQKSNIDLALAYDPPSKAGRTQMDLRDRETEGHTQRVAELTLRLARSVGICESELVHIRRGALLHDIGKMGVPDAILLKPGKLNDEEWEVMRQHPQYAYDMLAHIDYLQPALDIPYCHHEKWDGSGYPRRLKGEQIPLAARLFAVVDVYDAVTSDRPYRKAWSHEKALGYIKEQSGSHFDPEAVNAFLKEMGKDT